MLDCERGRVALLEGRKGKEALNHGGHVATVVGREESACMPGKRKDAPISEVLQACQAWPKDRLECIPCFVCEREVKVEVMLDLLVAVV